MAHANDENPDTDALLVAYLDGELGRAERADVERRLAADAGVRDRLESLQDGRRPFVQAFAAMLEAAPVEKLEAMLAALPEPGSSEVARTKDNRRQRLVPVAAAVAAAFVAGLVTAELAGTVFKTPSPIIADTSSSAPWRQAVAEYQALYTPEAVASISDNSEARRKELDTVGARLGLELSPEAISLANLEFKRAQLFGYDGEALGQLTYLHPSGHAVALCIIDDGQPAMPISSESREGMAVVYWSKQGRSFMLIGMVPDPELRNLALGVSNRL